MALILCHGGMYSGKSDMAITRVRSFSRNNLRRILYQPARNTRDVFQGRPVWFSRAGGDEISLLPAKFFESAEAVLSEKDNYDVFGFEEWQMYSPDIFAVIRDLHQSGKFVVAAGLDYYFNGEPVEIFDKLRSLEEVITFQGVCALCQDCQGEGKKTMAVRTQRTYLGAIESFDSDKIIVDGSKGYDYRPVCFKHWKVNSPRTESLNEAYRQHYLLNISQTTSK